VEKPKYTHESDIFSTGENPTFPQLIDLPLEKPNHGYKSSDRFSIGKTKPCPQLTTKTKT
jgi:hypothetical protein